MSVIVNLDVMLAKRKMQSRELASLVGISEQNLSILKTGKAKAIRFSTLEAICEQLHCQPGDLLAVDPEHEYQPPQGQMHKDRQTAQTT